MIEELIAASVEFAGLWSDHEVAPRRQDRKRILYPVLGLIEVNCLKLFSDDGRQRLIWFSPALGTESADALDMLAVPGAQSLAPDPT